MAFSFILMLAISALPQAETGQLFGRVVDPNGALVAGATVTVKSVGTGATRTVSTDSDGSYLVTNLQPGLYDVSVQAQGFNEVTQRTQITVGSRTKLDFTLAVAAVTGGTVEVVAGGGIEVNTQTQELSTVISENQIRQLPTLTRNPYNLVALSGNVSTADPTGRGAGVAINGQRAASTNILLDGVDNVDTFTATVGQSVPLDSVQEFRVVRGTFTPEYGRASGGVVNVATKSGTNEFRGTIYEFYRNAKLSSNSFDNNANGVPRQPFNRHQYGYSIGGPVILPNFNGRNKLFFFNSTEWIRVRSTTTEINVVPTPQLIAASNSNTQAFFSAYGTLATPINGRVFTVSEVISKLGISSGAFASLPPNMPALGQVIYQRPGDQGGGDPQNSYLTVSRIDWNLSDKTQIYGRYGLERVKLFDGTVSFSPYQGYNTGTSTLNQNIVLSITHTFSQRLVSQTKIAYNRLRTVQPLSSKGTVPTLYLFPNFPGSIDGFRIAFPGYLPFSPGSGIPFGGPQHLGNLNQDISYTIGSHQLRFGGQFVYIQDNRTFGAYQTASQILGSNFTNAFNNFVSGQLRQFQVAIDPQGKYPGDTITLPVGPPQFSRSNRYKDFALYFNDTWRVVPRVALNLGIRYEYYGVQRNKNPQLDSNFYFGSGSDIFQRIRNGQVFPAPSSPIGKLWKPEKTNFAPRIGFAWDIFGDGKTSLRGGYGIGYERNFGNVTFNVIQNPPNYAVISVLAPTDFPVIPISVSNYGILAGSSGTRVLPLTSLRHVREDIKTAYAHLYSVSLEREILPRTLLSVEFTGSAGRRLYDIANINRNGTGLRYLGSATPRPPAIGGTTTRLNGQYTNINTRGSNGRSNYNAIVLSLDSNNFLNLGLDFGARYTYGVTKDNLSSTFSESGNNFNLGYLDPFNPDLDYGNSDFDIRHRFIGNFTWNLPIARNAKGLTRQVLGGWTLAGIVEIRSGTPFTVYDCTNALTTCIRLIPTGSLRFKGSGNPPAVPGTPNRFNYIDLSNQSPSTFTDVSGFTEVGPFPSNMTKRNAFRGPGFWNVDLAIYKEFFFGEKYRLQLRGEFYNAFNHANLFVSGGETDISSINYVPAFREGRRNIQLAAKFIF